jgi:hypothetical protein
MSVSTETLGIQGTLPTQSPRTWEALRPAPTETLSLEEQQDKLQRGVLELLTDETGLSEFLTLGGEIAVSLYGRLTVTDPLDYTVSPETAAIDFRTSTNNPESTRKRGLYLIDYTDLVEMLKGRAEEMAILDQGDPNDPALNMNDEQRASLAENIKNTVNGFMYERFDEQLSQFLLAASLTGDITLQMNPIDTAKAIRQKHAWLNQAREKLNSAHDKNGIGNTSRVKIVLVPLAESPTV